MAESSRSFNSQVGKKGVERRPTHSGQTQISFYNKRGNVLLRRVGGLVFGLRFGLLSGLIGGLALGLLGAIAGAVVGWTAFGQGLAFDITDTAPLYWPSSLTNLITGLGFGLVAGLWFERGGSAGRQRFTHMRTPNRLVGTELVVKTTPNRSILQSAPSGLVAGLVAGLVFGVVFMLAGSVGTMDELVFGMDGLGGGLVLGLLGGLGGGLVLGLLIGLVVVLRGWHWDRGPIGLVAVMVNVLIFGLIYGLGLGWGGLALGLALGLVFGLGGMGGVLVCGLIGGLIFGSAYGGDTVLQHYTLRWLYYRNGSLPLRLVPFLDYCTERVFLRKVSGGYIFAHRLLMEHFASMYSEQPVGPPESERPTATC